MMQSPPHHTRPAQQWQTPSTQSVPPMHMPWKPQGFPFECGSPAIVLVAGTRGGEVGVLACDGEADARGVIWRGVSDESGSSVTIDGVAGVDASVVESALEAGDGRAADRNANAPSATRTITSAAIAANGQRARLRGGPAGNDDERTRVGIADGGAGSAFGDAGSSH